MTGTPHPRRNDPCSCGSGKRYKHCCGRVDVAPKQEEVAAAIPPFLDMPDKVLIVPGFLSPEECAGLKEAANALRTVEAQILRSGEGGLAMVPSNARITTLIKTFDSPDLFLPIGFGCNVVTDFP